LDAAPFQPPVIVLAYAKALFNLGYRYETAVGSRRNLEEAARCYWKAARLGDSAARERCESGVPGAAFLPYLPTSRPDEAPPYHDPTPPLATVYRPAVS
jgi:hypothetical protein